MRTVIPVRNVTTVPSAAYPSVPLGLAHRGPNVMHASTASTVLVSHLSRGMVTASVKDVSSCPKLAYFLASRAEVILFLFSAIVVQDPECRIDRDCPNGMSCVDERCQNLCQSRNPCLGNLECSVTESYDGSRTVACSCPVGFVAVSESHCEQGMLLLPFLEDPVPAVEPSFNACSFFHSSSTSPVYQA